MHRLFLRTQNQFFFIFFCSLQLSICQMKTNKQPNNPNKKCFAPNSNESDSRVKQISWITIYLCCSLLVYFLSRCFILSAFMLLCEFIALDTHGAHNSCLKSRMAIMKGTQKSGKTRKNQSNLKIYRASISSDENINWIVTMLPVCYFQFCLHY